LHLGEPALRHLICDERHRLGEQATATTALGVGPVPAKLANLDELRERAPRLLDDPVVPRVIAGVVIVDRALVHRTREVAGDRGEQICERTISVQLFRLPPDTRRARGQASS
jgi:hypothetical protein